MKTCMAVLILCTMAGAAAAQTVYKCTFGGRVSYRDQPCAQGTSTTVAPPASRGDAAAAAEVHARHKALLAEFEKEENTRLLRLQKAERERLRLGRAEAAQRKKCEHLRLKQQWAREDVAGAGGKAAELMEVKARRQAEAMAVECPG